MFQYFIHHLKVKTKNPFKKKLKQKIIENLFGESFTIQFIHNQLMGK